MANSWQLVLNIGVRASSATPPIGPQDSFSAGTQKTFCAGLGRNWRRQTQAEPGALGCAWGAVEYDFGANWNGPAESATTPVRRPHRLGSCGNECQGCHAAAPVSLH